MIENKAVAVIGLICFLAGILLGVLFMIKPQITKSTLFLKDSTSAVNDSIVRRYYTDTTSDTTFIQGQVLFLNQDSVSEK